MTSFLFRVRNIPSALYKAMGGFATNGVNMTKLESYMENGVFTATLFFAEVDGRPEDDNLARAFEELRFFSDHFQIVGVFEADAVPGERDPGVGKLSAAACIEEPWQRADRPDVRNSTTRSPPPSGAWWRTSATA